MGTVTLGELRRSLDRPDLPDDLTVLLTIHRTNVPGYTAVPLEAVVHGPEGHLVLSGTDPRGWADQ